ncbi:hypothetical protein GS19_00655 [Acinetobacter idrijaensis]|nr:hypothetical protein GS19_00655 [Acinetobacter idrijaensis]
MQPVRRQLIRIRNMQISIQSIDVVFVISSLKWIWDFEYKKAYPKTGCINKSNPWHVNVVFYKT